jgi:LexA-binding, inner membrane-associated putative hydrolase
MPNANVHRTVGTAVGLGYGYFAAQDQPALPKLVETLGSGCGGWLGAALPDWIDPATSPNHRHHGHGIANFAGATFLTVEAVADLQQQFRRRAELIRARRPYLTTDFAKFLSWIEEILLCLLIGLLNGISAGYLSHLCLDAATARGIPLFARGF